VARRRLLRQLAVAPARSLRGVDVYCLARGGTLRIGYARRRAEVVLTSSPGYRLGAERVGARHHVAPGERRIRARRMTWWLQSGARVTRITAVRAGRVAALGVAEPRHARRRVRQVASA
jgi:hypothetical protein